MDEKKYVAKDYQHSNNEWLGLFGKKDQNVYKSYLNICLFYIGPFVTTAIFSILLYPRIVYITKKIFKLKSFFSINMVILILNIILGCCSYTFVFQY
jgi:hypothetical protein